MLTASPLMANAQTDYDDDVEVEAKKKIHVAFGDKTEDQLLGGVSFVDMEELQKIDHTTGSLDDLYALVGGWNGGNLWGQDDDRLDTNDNGNLPLVLIDGIKRPSNNVLPSEIEQVTFLKGAQAVVLYGPKAAKGVILITTKRGKIDGLQIEANVNTGWHVAKAFPDYLGSAEYMTLYNEGRVNDGLEPKYSQQDIYNYASGINPYRYPNVNWYSDEYVRKAYNRSEATIEIQGGAERARFYTNVNYYRNEDLINFGEGKNNYTDRFSVRGNVDLKVNDLFRGFVDVSATFYNANKNKGNFWEEASTMRPNYPENAAPLIPIDMVDPNASKPNAILDKSINLLGGRFFPGGSTNTRKNAIAECYFGGQTTDVSRQFQFDAGLIYDMSKFVKGLQFRTQFAIDYASNYSVSYNNEYAVFIPTWSNYNGEDIIVALKQEGDERHTGNKAMSNGNYRQTISWNGHFNYDNTFNDVHHVTGILVANMFTTTSSGSYHRYASPNVGLQVGYDYASRYYADFALAGVHSARLPEGNRQALSPSVTFGWRLSNEQFMEDTFVDDLILSASYSDVNEDIDVVNGDKQFYIYDASWATSGGSFAWDETKVVDRTYSQNGKNPVLDYIHRKEFSVNVHGSFWKKLITADLTYFNTDMSGYIVDHPSNFPSHLTGGLSGSSFMPSINHNVNNRSGFDFSLKAQKQVGELYAALGVVGTILRTRRSTYDHEIKYEYQNQEEGKPIDAIWGYKSLGFYSESDFDRNPETGKLTLKEGMPKIKGASPAPGDIMYSDTNGDGSIDDNDMIYLGKYGWYGAPLTLGLNLTFKYKGFTLFMLGNGNFGAKAMKNISYYYAYGENKYSVFARERWTSETSNSAKYPRLTTTGFANNIKTSDFWMYSTDRFNLRKVQLTYDFPSKLLSGKIVKALTIYLSGNDLLTIAKERELMELNIGSAPQTRFYNFGAKVTF